jgi:hypothetical protein
VCCTILNRLDQSPEPTRMGPFPDGHRPGDPVCAAALTGIARCGTALPSADPNTRKQLDSLLRHLWLWRGNTTSWRSSWIVAAIGTAINAPTMPKSEPPISVAMMVSPGVTFTVCFMTRGFTR